MRTLFGVALLGLIPALAANAADYVTVKGRIAWDDGKGAVPVRTPVKPTKDEEVCAKDKDFNSEEWVVDGKTKGIKNVVVWLIPEPPAAVLADIKAGKKNDAGERIDFASFDKKDVHPALAAVPKDPAVIDQPCCRFIPHVVVAREGQGMLIKNSAIVPHNAKWVSRNNGEINPLIPAGGQFMLQAPLKAEKFPINIECSIHPWMKAYIRVFDHPYYAITDKDGNFEIKDAPVLDGKLRMFIWQENGFHGGKEGRFGQAIAVKAGAVDLKDIKFDVPK